MTQETINEQEKTKGVMSLNQVVASVLNKRGDYSKHGHKRLLQFAIEGYREFGLYHTPFIEREWIKVNQDVNTVALPDQIMEFMSVGIPIDGKYWEFSKKDDGIIPEGDKCLNKTRQEAQFPDAQPIQNYAMGGGYNSYNYTYEKAKRRLVLFTPYHLDEVLVIYKSTGINKNGNTLIPIHAFMALRAWIEWEDIDSIDKKSMNEKIRKQQNYLFHAKNMRDVENKFTAAEFLDAVRSGHGQTFKR